MSTAIIEYLQRDSVIKRIRRFARRCGIPVQDLDDVLQDLRLRILSSEGKYDERHRPSSWVFHVTPDVIYARRHFLRKQIASHQAAACEPYEPDPFLWEAVLAAGDPMVEFLEKVAGERPAVIAERHGVARRTVYRRIELAKKRLRKILTMTRSGGK